MPVRLEDKTIVPICEPERWIGHGDSGDVGGWPFAYLPPIDPWARQNVPYALVGFDIRSGSLVDGVTPLYRELKDDGNVGEVVAGYPCGGWGGHQVHVEDSGFVVVGLTLLQAQYTDQMKVVRQLWSAQGLFGSVVTSLPLGGSGGYHAYINAPPGHCAIGIYGKSGSLLDRISIVTARPVIF
jgi:hypothetical protein